MNISMYLFVFAHVKFMFNIADLVLKRNVSWKVNCLINISSSSSYERNQINDSFLSPEPSKLAFTSTGALFLLSRYVTKELKSTISISSFVFKSNPPLTYVFMSRKTIYRFNFL